jgi:hypothetical protein
LLSQSFARTSSLNCLKLLGARFSFRKSLSARAKSEIGSGEGLRLARSTRSRRDCGVIIEIEGGEGEWAPGEVCVGRSPLCIRLRGRDWGGLVPGRNLIWLGRVHTTAHWNNSGNVKGKRCHDIGLARVDNKRGRNSFTAHV